MTDEQIREFREHAEALASATPAAERGTMFIAQSWAKSMLICLAEIDRLRLRWTPWTPQVPGMWLRRAHWSARPIVQIWTESEIRPPYKCDTVRWCGPLEIGEGDNEQVIVKEGGTT